MLICLSLAEWKPCVFLFCLTIQIDGKDYEYHEPNQSPLEPPYAEASDLLKNGTMDLRKPNSSVVRHDLASTSIKNFKLEARGKKSDAMPGKSLENPINLDALSIND